MRPVILSLCMILISGSLYSQDSYKSSLTYDQFTSAFLSQKSNLNYGIACSFGDDNSALKLLKAGSACTAALSPAIISLCGNRYNQSDLPAWQKDMRLDMRTRTWICSGLFVPIVLTGYKMSSSDEKPGPLVFNIHKLSSVTNLILLDGALLKKRKSASLTTAETIAAIAMNFSFVTTIGTGGALSVGKPMPSLVHDVHSLAPWATIVSSSIVMYLLNRE